MKKEYTFLADPGHSWLQVPINDFLSLGLKNCISRCSYIDEKYVYLEEDCDAFIFLASYLKENDSYPEIKEKFFNDRIEFLKKSNNYLFTDNKSFSEKMEWAHKFYEQNKEKFK